MTVCYRYYDTDKVACSDHIVQFRSEDDYEIASDNHFVYEYEWFFRYVPENAVFESVELYNFVTPQEARRMGYTVFPEKYYLDDEE